MTDGTIDAEALDAWSQSRPHIVLVNAAINPAPGPKNLPPELLAQLGGRRPDFLVATREEIERAGIVPSHNHLAGFLRGEPVLVVVSRVEHRDALKRGRRRKEEIERQVQDEFAVQTYVGVERLCGWLRARDGRLLSVTVPELRDRVFGLLAETTWQDDPNAGAATTCEDRISFFRTQYDAGGRLVATWYAWERRPDDLSRVARQVVEMSAWQMDRALISEAIDRETASLRFLLGCLRRATTLVLTEHAMSAEIGRRGSMSRHRQAVLAGAVSDRPTLYEAMRAALDGDFDPSDLFRSLLSYHDTLEIAPLIGRHGRGHDVRLEPDMADELRREFSVWAEFDAQDLQPGGPSSTPCRRRSNRVTRVSRRRAS